MFIAWSKRYEGTLGVLCIRVIISIIRDVVSLGWAISRTDGLFAWFCAGTWNDHGYRIVGALKKKRS